MVIKSGEKVHIIARKLWENDHRRHFIATVKELNGTVARLEGYAFVFNPFKDEFVRRPELRTRIIDLASSHFVVNVVPAATKLEKVHYTYSDERRLIVTDGGAFLLDINEYSPGR